ncbi:hypothetical protein ACFX2J_014351 [Malus domestica]
MICYIFCLRPEPLVYSFSFRSVLSCAEDLWSSIHGIMKIGKHRGQLKVKLLHQEEPPLSGFMSLRIVHFVQA